MEKLYTKEEVESLLFKYANDEWAIEGNKQDINNFNNWVEENL